MQKREKHEYTKEDEDIYIYSRIEYTLDGASTFTFMKYKLLRHTRECRHHNYYNEELQ